MPRKSWKAKLVLDEKQKEQLKTISQSRKAPIREVQRANILLRYSEDIPVTDIEKMVHVSGRRFTNGWRRHWLWEQRSA